METCVQVQKQQLEQDMEQQNGSKLGKEYVKTIYHHTAYWTYMQSEKWKWKSLSRVQVFATSCEMPGWINHKLE